MRVLSRCQRRFQHVTDGFYHNAREFSLVCLPEHLADFSIPPPLSTGDPETSLSGTVVFFVLAVAPAVCRLYSLFLLVVHRLPSNSKRDVMLFHHWLNEAFQTKGTNSFLRFSPSANPPRSSLARQERSVDPEDDPGTCCERESPFFF